MMAALDAAPSYLVPRREIVALEHPMIIKNTDRGLKTLGTGVTPRQLMAAEGHNGCFPLYLRPTDPTCAPLLSHNTPTGNVLLKITVPKRTGRKRKRGSEDPWITVLPASKDISSLKNGFSTNLSMDINAARNLENQTSRTSETTNLWHPLSTESLPTPTTSSRESLKSEPPAESIWKYAKPSSETEPAPGLRSHARLDSPKDLLRTLKDNVEKYRVKAVGTIHHTHRYRGMADFHYSTSHGKFMTHFRDTVLKGNVQDLRRFKLDPSRGPKENEELIPGPTLSDKTLPFNWGYHQNSTIKVTTDDNTGEQMLINNSAVPKLHTFYVTHDCETVPTEPPTLPPPEPMITAILTELQQLLDERPIWTRRAIMNHLSNDNPALYLLKPAIQYLAYQFRGGPWRDAIVKYGVDPRKDPKYRIYQTLFFKVVDERLSMRQPGDPWHDIRSEYTRRAQRDNMNVTSHIFDGQSISLDGKIWQVCDITDPMLRKLLDTEILRTECDDHDGWFCNGTMAKVKAVMRTKITAIQLGRNVAEEDFAKTLEIADHVKDKEWFQAKMPVLRVLDDLLPGEVAEGEQQMSGGMVDLKVKQGSAWRKRRMREIKKRKLALGLLDENDTLLSTRRGRLTARKLMGQYNMTVGAPQDIVPSSSGDPRVDEAMRHLPGIEGYRMQAAVEDEMGVNAEDEDDDFEDDLSDEEDVDDEQDESEEEDDDDGEDAGLVRDDMGGAFRGNAYQDGMDEVLEGGSVCNDDVGGEGYDEGLGDNRDVRRVT